MAKNKATRVITAEIVINRIINVRGNKVMIDKDIAELYGVTTKRLNEQVKRNKRDFLLILCFN